MGKTMIPKRFRDQHPPSFNSLTCKLKTPVLAMEMTSRPGERRFYAEFLTLLAIALANKMARTIWVMLTKQEDYRDPALAMAA